MKKKRIKGSSCLFDNLPKIYQTMKLICFLMFVALLQVSASTYSQTKKLTLVGKNLSLEEVFELIEDQSEFSFLYNLKQVDLSKEVDVDFKNEQVEKILNHVLKGSDITYTVDDRLIVIHKKKEVDLKSSIDETQQISISGNVTDENRQPLPGVTVVVKGTTQGTVTNADGEYSLTNIPDDATLVFSFVGMRTQEVPVENRPIINVVMSEDMIGMDEVVVVGYGVQKKENLTGSVVAVTGETISKRQVGQTSMALQGIAPGITVVQRSGQPGKDGGTIRIRGIGTMGDSNPLVLVDGVEMNINNIDPNIIESISVLKDAASASIYGSRAANGVILITTKRAKENVFSITYSGYTGIQQPTDLRDMVSAQDHMSLLNTAYINAGKSPLFDEDLVNNYDALHNNDPVTYPDNDWQDQVYTKNGLTQNHFLTLNGGTERMKLMAGFGYYDQQGLIENTDFKRYSIRLNSDIIFSEKFSAKLDMYLRQMETNEPGTGIEDVIYWLNRMPATQPVVNPDGTFAIGWDGDNPYAKALGSGYQKVLTPSVMMNLGFNYKFSEALNLDFNYSPHFWEDHLKDFRKIVATYFADGTLAYTKPPVSSLSQRNTRSRTNNLRTTLNYEKSFDEHNFKVLAGFQQEDFMNRWFSGFRDNFVLPEYDELGAGGKDNQKSDGSGSEWALRSYFGRINYDISGKYLFEANVRYDGSSRFASGRKWGVFPSFSAGWRISEENFWESLSSSIDNLKFRASWGQLGNQNIGTYPFDSFVSLDASYVFNGNIANGAALTDMANSLISWETTEMLNFGIDATVFEKLSASFDYYIRNTSGILLQLDVPKIIGLNEPYQNAGEVENKGWDFSLNYADRKGDFSYDIGFSLSDVKNKVLDMKGVNDAGLVVNREGYPMGSIYALEAIGFFQDEQDIANHAQQYGNYAAGDIKYKDQLTIDTDGDGIFDAADGVINDEDRKIIGNTLPRYTFGLTANMSWKAFDLNLLLQGVGKADGYLYSQSVMPFFLGGTAQEIHKDYWRPDNTSPTFPRLVFNEPNNEKNSSFWMKDASYMRLKNLQIGYTLPGSCLNSVGIKKIRAYFSGQNLFTLDKFWDGFDVEAPVGNGSFYPQVKVYTFGVDVNF